MTNNLYWIVWNTYATLCNWCTFLFFLSNKNRRRKKNVANLYFLKRALFTRSSLFQSRGYPWEWIDYLNPNYPCCPQQVGESKILNLLDQLLLLDKSVHDEFSVSSDMTLFIVQLFVVGLSNVQPHINRLKLAWSYYVIHDEKVGNQSRFILDFSRKGNKILSWWE